jgi:hypothetical protein
MVEQIRDDQAHGQDQQQIPNRRVAKAQRDWNEENAEIAVVDAQAESEGADGPGVTRRLQAKSEAKEDRHRLDRYGAEKPEQQNAAWGESASEGQ